MQVIPAIDLLGGKIVRLRQGNYESSTDYSLAAEAVTEKFIDAGARWVHVVDLDAARTGRPTNFEQIGLVRKLTEGAGVKVQLGGGARDEKTVEYMLSRLADRVIVGSAAIGDWNWFERLLENKGIPNDRLALALDARKGQVAVEGWTRQLDLSALDFARCLRGSGLGAVVYTDIARDGMLSGVNAEATAELIAATDVPIIASGGISSLQDIERCRDIGCAGVIVGRAYYEGRIDLAEAIRISGGGI